MEFLETNMKGALKLKSTKLLQSLNGRLRNHHRDVIRLSWEHLLYIERTITQVERQTIYDKKHTSFGKILVIGQAPREEKSISCT
jgi:hypothetical protein